MARPKARFAGDPVIDVRGRRYTLANIVAQHNSFKQQMRLSDDDKALIKELHSAVWMARRMVVAGSHDMLRQDVQAELEALTRLSVTDPAQPELKNMSHDVWWPLVSSNSRLTGQDRAPETASEWQEALSHLRLDALPSKRRPNEYLRDASIELTSRVVATMEEHRIPVSAYADNAGCSIAVNLLLRLGELAGIFRPATYWRDSISEIWRGEDTPTV